MHRSIIRKLAISALLALASMVSVGAADLQVPEFGLTVSGQIDDTDHFILSSRAAFDLLIKGGESFSAFLDFGFHNNDLESYLYTINAGVSIPAAPTVADLSAAITQLESLLGLEFRGTGLTVQSLFGSPLELSLFLGHFDVFASGDDFTRLFNAKSFATRIRGPLYYPDGIGDNGNIWYDGLHEVFGTGLRLSFKDLPVTPYLYVYQDAWLGEGYYSVDARLLFNSDLLKLEAYLGASMPVGSAGAYRGGILFYVDTAAIGSFYAQIGVPWWRPDETFSLGNLYFMFEPRLQYGFANLIITLFFHPAWYLQQTTGMGGVMDLRINLMIGDIDDHPVQGGLDSRATYNPNLATGNIQFELTPYIQTISNGVRWEIRLSSQLLPLPLAWYRMFAPAIKVTTTF
ncbi:MAG: hypothetical protein A2087_11930 [Spirochaetes bacterium GWD1_61_31]|nr:MAG: hypothetical protein A2Y37_07050 [Spirochaetes bacterium GWB1_60_80]OHD30829.1 MAG: hypothetical protein A2004_04575 [Spirochaetes bacterium GWC1_61_12]OHD37380.1 MAG: hypothetical protein A2087_11930 [Spirochaetes bacterium GWD1_61_31]OHD46329.1 MAG: hypothetical protein A2Y35_07325 [Spirochaetes bacterium GWE1_60_18]OHD60936.1 MAG: hypothetical protein A2Y32_12070 [Spirochaetes bacterium GWF1_60_12]HAP42806.1 hypothetical protein [Spirochaetaceae bacterium]